MRASAVTCVLAAITCVLAALAGAGCDVVFGFSDPLAGGGDAGDASDAIDALLCRTAGSPRTAPRSSTVS